MLWFLADTHFQHEAAIQFNGREFESLGKMHKCLIDNWNLVVGEDDICYILGDYMFGNDAKILAAITRQLHGKKVLVRGNHDTFPPNAYINAGFYKYYDVPILLGTDLLCSHEPVLTIGGDGLINLHGHTHGRKFLLQSDKHFCVSAECISMKPISYKEIQRWKGITAFR